MDWDGKGRERMIWDGGIENSETLGVLSGEVDEAVLSRADYRTFWTL